MSASVNRPYNRPYNRPLACGVSSRLSRKDSFQRGTEVRDELKLAGFSGGNARL